MRKISNTLRRRHRRSRNHLRKSAKKHNTYKTRKSGRRHVKKTRRVGRRLKLKGGVNYILTKKPENPNIKNQIKNQIKNEIEDVENKGKKYLQDLEKEKDDITYYNKKIKEYNDDLKNIKLLLTKPDLFDIIYYYEPMIQTKVNENSLYDYIEKQNDATSRVNSLYEEDELYPDENIKTWANIVENRFYHWYDHFPGFFEKVRGYYPPRRYNTPKN